MTDLDAIIQEHLQKIADQLCKELAEAWAAAIQGTAPVDTGLLAGSATSRGDSIYLQNYWKWVAYGHKIYSRKTQSLIVKRIDSNGDDVFKMTKPNDYMEKAWDSPEVQEVLNKYSGKGVHVPYPLSKVDMNVQNN
jgi:hypothetical protein